MNLIRSHPGGTGGQMAVVDRGDQVQVRRVAWDQRSRGLKDFSEFYRALSERQRVLPQLRDACRKVRTA